MNKITFIDTEISISSKRIEDIGAIKENDETFHSNNVTDFESFINDSKFIAGHNILEHDLMYLYKKINISKFSFIDTLFWSPLLFPEKPYHKLLKDDKLQVEEVNNPVNDAIKARELFYDEVNQFNLLDEELKNIFYFLLKTKKRFKGFFKYLNFNPNVNRLNIEKYIYKRFSNSICQNIGIHTLIKNHPIELAYSLALISIQDRYSITPPWVLKRFKEVQRIMYLLRNNPCIIGCNYCSQSLNIYLGLKKHFGFESFRTYNDEPLQENAAQAAIDNKSLLKFRTLN